MSDFTIRSMIEWLGPQWFTRDKDVPPDGVETDSRVLTTLGLFYNATRDRVAKGVRARFPGGGAPEDALSYIGRDRQIVRGPNESREAWEKRLQRAWDDWQLAGIPWSMLEQLRAYFSPELLKVATVDNHGEWHVLNADGTRTRVITSAWNWDSDVAKWSRFWVVLYMPSFVPYAPSPVWGSQWGGAWGNPGYTWGSTATTDDIAGVRKIVRTWKPAGTRCVHIVIVFDDSSGAFDPAAAAPPAPDGTWTLWANREPGAIYVDG